MALGQRPAGTLGFGSACPECILILTRRFPGSSPRAYDPSHPGSRGARRPSAAEPGAALGGEVL
jgi:hypothetical protein